MAHIEYPTTLNNRYINKQIPYILDYKANYLSGFNSFIQLRCSGRLKIKNGIFSEISLKLIPPNTVHAIAHRIVNFASWLEVPEAHPLLGIISWDQVEKWHVTDLYRDAMIGGYWTQEFWASGNRIPLNFASTIGPRLKEVKACYEWLKQEGIHDWEATERPSFFAIQGAQSAARTSFRESAPADDEGGPLARKYNRRTDPGDWSPLTHDQIRIILSYLKTPEVRLACITYLTTAMRLEEFLNNSLVPGEYHQRTEYELKFSEPFFPRTPYKLAYDIRDDAMIGVLPSMEAAFAHDAPTYLEYRIIGKGPKIRTVWLLSSLVRQYWRYFVSGRRAILKTKTGLSAYFFLNRLGNSLNGKNVSSAILEARKQAKKDLLVDIPITPHVLRHTFACYFIEAAIGNEAKKEGLEVGELSIEDYERFGGQAAIVLQKILGHVYLEHTLRYVRQLAQSRTGLRYLTAFHEAIEEAFE